MSNHKPIYFTICLGKKKRQNSTFAVVEVTAHQSEEL